MQGKAQAVKLSDTLWEIPRNEGEGMRVPARIYATEKLFREMDGGSMETGSYLLRGTEDGGRALFTTAHGSGRVMGRRQANKKFSGRRIADSMRARGIYVAAASESGLAEEAGRAT